MSDHPTDLWPHYADDERQAVGDVLASGNVNYWTGDKGKAFEAEFARASDCEFGIAVANGSVALELALVALGLNPGDEVIVPSYTFIASASAVVLRGGTPVFADVDSSLTIDAANIESKITHKTKGIIVVHLLGYPCDMDPILELARENELFVLEDCAQAHGASYKGKAVGSMGDMAAFSFCQDKIMTTGGEGGMVTTNRADLYEVAWSYKDHGKNRPAMQCAEKSPGFNWLHDSFGTNWRMTEMQAAIGLIQLTKLCDWICHRRENASLLDRYFESIDGLVRPDFGEARFHVFYRYSILVPSSLFRTGWNRDRLVGELNSRGVVCGSGICPEVYLEQAFQKAGLGPGDRLLNSMTFGEMSIQFPVHPNMSGSYQQHRLETLQEVFAESTCG